VLTYDLRKERRTVGHLTREGQFTSLSQRTDSEQELVTCDAQVGGWGTHETHETDGRVRKV